MLYFLLLLLFTHDFPTTFVDSTVVPRYCSTVILYAILTGLYAVGYVTLRSAGRCSIYHYRLTFARRLIYIPLLTARLRSRCRSLRLHVTLRYLHGPHVTIYVRLLPAFDIFPHFHCSVLTVTFPLRWITVDLRCYRVRFTVYVTLIPRTVD